MAYRIYHKDAPKYSTTTDGKYDSSTMYRKFDNEEYKTKAAAQAAVNAYKNEYGKSKQKYVRESTNAASYQIRSSGGNRPAPSRGLNSYYGASWQQPTRQKSRGIFSLFK